MTGSLDKRHAKLLLLDTSILVAAILFLAACRSQEKPADLFFRSPAVSYVSGDRSERALEALQTVALGLNDRVAVGDRGEGRLLFGDNLEVRIFRNSKIALEGQAAAGATPLQKMRLEAGTAFATLNAQEAAEARLETDTKWATIVALGTAYLTHYDPEREMTWVVVKEGQVLLMAGGKEITVGAGQQAWVERGGNIVGPVPACRDVVGDRFPLVEQLTEFGLTDMELLPCPRQAPAPIVAPPPAPPAQPPQPAKPAPATPRPPKPAIDPRAILGPLMGIVKDLLTRIPPPSPTVTTRPISPPDDSRQRDDTSPISPPDDTSPPGDTTPPDDSGPPGDTSPPGETSPPSESPSIGQGLRTLAILLAAVLFVGLLLVRDEKKGS